MSRAGVSFVELLLAAAIVAFAMVPILTVFWTAGEGLKQTVPYYQAVLLGEKTAESIRRGALEDPFYPDRLLVGGLGAARTSVVRGLSPFFEVIEDTSEPFGRCEPGKDLSIDPRAGTLYAFAEPLGIGVRTVERAAAPPDPGEVESVIEMDWRDTRGQELRYHVATPVMRWSEVQGIDAPARPIGDAALGAALEPASAKTLATLIAERGAGPALEDLARLLALGDLGRRLVAQARPAIDKLAGDERDAASEPGKLLAKTRRARLREGLVSGLLYALAEMQPPMERLAAALPPGALGTPPPSRELRQQLLSGVRDTYAAFHAELVAALSESGEVASTARPAAGERASAHLRVVRLAKLELVAGGATDVGPLTAHVRDLREFYRGRMPNLEHLFAVEEAKLAALPTSYPLYRTACAVRAVHDAFASVGVRLLLYGDP